MNWGDYIQGYNYINIYMAEKYGELGKYMIKSMDTRIPIPLNDKLNIVTSINKMVFGQFIMAERALTSGKSYEQSLYELAISILRPIGDVVFDNTDEVKEQTNLDLIMQQHAKDVLSECIIFSEKRNKFVKEDFKGVFYKPDDEDIDDEDIDDGEEQTFEEGFNKDWYWYTIVDSLANHDFLKHQDVLMSNMGDVAPHLAYMRMKGIIEYKRRKMEQVASKLRR